MDLPPLSYHDSLEELWDEEQEPEEIESVMKVVPSVYNQYLDVFSKVKAEKLPPHHACDHHIELEGSLPPSVSPTQRGIHDSSNPSLPPIVETNVSNYALGAVLSQVSDSGKHPIAFDSGMHTPAELNYEIHDKVLLGIVWDLKCWSAFRLSLYSPFEVLINHSALQSFMSSKVLSHRQARWAEFRPEFHFSITYCPGFLATLPNALSRCDDIYTERGEDFIIKNPMNFQQLIRQDEVQPSRFFAVKWNSFQILLNQFRRNYGKILGAEVSFKNLVVLPNDPTIQLSILQKRNDSALAGHPGQENIRFDYETEDNITINQQYYDCSYEIK
ncbi:hypothetical protein O181_097050 [Austropuccinia psidii MF-1]|uniref:Reverse transcriptase RNase H-like domain-containing protein n=1 Tax=Austropuccinia psidii MF-1 TaxID=1389203 RepID=A0A9Q3J8T2_9BASI|nr:hypothetical protein [Austropuccinia psidii MF-1]